MNWWALKRRIHVSWLIAIACSGFFVGVFTAQYLNIYILSSFVFLLISVMLIGLSIFGRHVYLMPVLIIGSVLLGLWRGTVSTVDLAQFKPMYGYQISVTGMVKDDVDSGTSDQIVIRLDDLIINDKSLPGVLWISASSADVKRGDKLVVSGKLKEGFGNFAGVMYRATVDTIIHPQPGDTARLVRDWFADLVQMAIPEPESSWGLGYLVGQRRSLPADLALALQIAGLTHVVVASGYNLTILVRLARRLFVKVSKYLSALSASVMIVAFMAITGMSPSMSRAGLVAGLSLAAWYYGRQFHPIILLSIAVAVTVMINPSYAWGDLGWQLSFAAFAGVMIIAPLAQRYFFGDKKLGFVPQILVETVSAQVATVPIIVAAFGQLSNVAVITNLLVLPLVPLAMLLTFIAGIGALILPFAAGIIGLPATWLLGYMVNVAELAASLPWASSNLQLSGWGVVICYVMIIGFCWYMWRVAKFNLRGSNLVE